MLQPFRNRIASGVVARTNRQSSGAGAAIADGVARLGQTVGGIAAQDAEVQDRVAASEHRLAVEERRRAIAAASADAFGRYAVFQGETAKALEEARLAAPPGAQGYAEKASTLIADRVAKFRDTLPEDDEIRQRFDPMLAEFGVRTESGERAFARDRWLKHQGAQIEQWETVTNNRVSAATDPGELEKSYAEVDALIASQDMDATTADALRSRLRASIGQSFIDGMFVRGEGERIDALDKAGFLDVMALDAAPIRKRIGQAREQAAIDAERQAAAAERAVKEQYDAFEAQIALGVVPTEAEFRAIGQSIAVLPPEYAVKLEGMRTGAAVNRATQGWTAAQVGAEVNRITAKVATGNASKAEQMQRSFLQKRQAVLEDQEADQYKALLAQGPAGELQAVNSITGDAETRFAVAEKVKPGLGMVALLPDPLTRQTAIEGRDIRKARPQDFGKPDLVKRAIDAAIGPAILAELGGNSGATRDLAWDIYTGIANRAGRSGFDPGSPQDVAGMAEAVRIASGGRERRDGTKIGGIAKVRGKPVQLPDFMSAGEFRARIESLGFETAVYGDKAPARKADVIANYQPRWIGDDAAGNPVYHLFDAAGDVLMDKKGVPYPIVMKPPQ
jgi:hypothetical protein